MAQGIAVARKAVDQRFVNVLDHGKTAGHVAVQGAVANGHFRFVAGGQHQRTRLVRDRHQDIAANTRLNVFFGRIGRQSHKQGIKHLAIDRHRRRNGNFVVAHAKNANHLA